MSAAAGSPPPPPDGAPTAAAGAGGDPARRRRWRRAIAAGVLGACVISVVAALALRPSEPSGYDAALQREVEAACRRSAPDLDDPEVACRCASRRLADTVPFDRLVSLEDELRQRGRPPAELVAAVEGCRVGQG